MSRQRLVLLAALGLVMVVTGFFAVFGAPDDGKVTGIWPVGVATGAAILAGRRWLLPVLLVVLSVAVVTIWAGGRPLEVAVGYSLGTVGEVWLIWRLLTRNGTQQPSLQDDGDMRWFFGATSLGALVAATAGLVTSALTGWGNPWLVALALGSAHLASELTLLPFFAKLLPHPAVAPLGERIAQWTLILVVTPLVFWPNDFPSVVFVVIPLLGWGALRNTQWEALLQMLAVLGIAVFFTTAGLGPLAHVPEQYGMPVDARGVILATYAIDCAMIAIPLMLTVARQLENARQAAAERDKVQNIVNSATGVAIIGTDEVGRITLWNPGAEQLLGYTHDEVLGRFTTMLHSPAGIREKARELGVADDFIAVALAMAAPESAGRDMKFLTKSGEERTHSMTLTRMTDERGRVTGHVSTSEDVTERVQAQEALVEALETERRAVERLREVDQVKDSFVSSVSHELRTPITSIVGYLEMLSDGAFGDLNADQADAVRRVSDNSDRLLALIDDLLTLSRVQDEGLTVTDRAFDLRQVVRKGHDVVAPAWVARDLAVTLELPEEPIPFFGDRDMVERVMVNLIGNAVKFTPDGGRVGIRMERVDDGAEIAVSDTGIGIPASEQEQLFSRFFRSSVAQQRAIPGSGLGLSIAKAVVEKHGGSVRVESVLDEGTTFHVWLPAVV
ncbi:PAS domain S-box protein [Nocardioides sp. KIGAM211]|uniref:histidine kinase n=1 Tax=Nocardioides luti TaxID=2761101 RepID=A0A7X0V9K7_9ACTN|nr:ATP-binding protein [Nocardioides luti]MBB6626774.1 PAS domain S-box protein [Nocardioides luti]